MIFNIFVLCVIWDLERAISAVSFSTLLPFGPFTTFITPYYVVLAM